MVRLIVFILFYLSIELVAQSNSFGVTGGALYYTGDLNKKHFKFLNPAGGLIYRYNFFNRRLALRIHGLFGEISAEDAKSNSTFQQNRNLSFKSRIIEIGPMLEINFLPYRIGDAKNEFFTPYLFFGLVYTNFEPRAEINGQWYDLKTVGTEGQMVNNGKGYSGSTMSFPVGVGVKWNFAGAWALNIEFGARVAFTDYLDDVSKDYVEANVFNGEGNTIGQTLADRSLNGAIPGTSRGDSFDKDWYYYAGIGLFYRIGGPITKCNERFRRKKAPTF